MAVRGVSPYVSALILTVMVLGLGSVVLLSFLSYVDARYGELEREFLRSERVSMQGIGVLYAYIDLDGFVRIAMVSSGFPTKLLGIYINGTLANCSVEVGSSSYSLPDEEPTVPPYGLAIARCGPVDGSFVEVKIVYEGGEVVLDAQRI